MEKSITKWISEQGIKISEEQIERVNRLRSKRAGGEPRPVIIKFTREKLQQQIFLALKKNKELEYKGGKVFVRQDFCQEMLKEKSLMKPYVERLFQNKILFTWAYPACIVIYREGKRLTARNPAEAVRMLEKLGIEPEDIELQPTDGTRTEEEQQEETATQHDKWQRTFS